MIQTLQFKNKIFKKNSIKELIHESFNIYGKTRTSFVINSFKDLGFYYATKSGLSIGVEDLQVPVKKKDVISESWTLVKHLNSCYKSGQLSMIEKSNSILYTWTEATQFLAETLVTFLKNFDPLNSLHLMVFSGARGNLSQVTQLMGLRGLMSDPTGHLLEIPIVNNFRDGLNIIDYLQSTYGARKGLVDTALKTADAGYFTRRLINAINDLIIKDFDCLTPNFLKIYKQKSKLHFIKELIGRTSVDNIYDFKKQNFIIYKNTCITEKIATHLFFSYIRYIRVYSVLTCQLANSVCKKCYGWDMAYHQSIKLGTVIGVIAAHSIGEPATQLTMRTFHTGGNFTLSISRKIFSKFNGFISYDEKNCLEKFRTQYGTFAKFVLKSLFLTFISYTNSSNKIFLQVNDILYVLNNQFIVTKTLLAEIFIGLKIQRVSSIKSIIAPHSGELHILSDINLFSLLKGNVYQFLNGSFLNFFYNLKDYTKPYLLFNLKVYSLISGFLNYSVNLEKVNELQLIKDLQVFIFPLFWDRGNKQIIFLGNYQKYFILEHLPLFLNTEILLFAKQFTKQYDLSISGFLFFVLSKLKSLSFFNYKTISSNTILLYVPHKSVLLKHPKISNLKKKRQNLNLLEFNFLPINSVVRYSRFKFNSFYKKFHNLNQIYVKGELLLDQILIPFLTQIKIIFTTFFIYIYFRASLTLNISKNKSFKTIGYFSLMVIPKTFFLLKSNKGVVKYTGNSSLLFSLILWLKVKTSYYKVKLYSSYLGKYLMFTLCPSNSLKQQFFLENRFSTPILYKFELVKYEYILKHTIIYYLYTYFINFGAYKKLKKTFNNNSRLLIINSHNLFTYYFETLKHLKSNFGFVRYNSRIAPFVTLLLSGKVYFYGAFSTSLHLGTPFFLSKNVQLFHSSKNFIQRGEIFGFIYFNQILTGDIVQGLPKLEELVELQILGNPALYSDQSGLLISTKSYVQKNSIKFHGINKFLNKGSCTSNLTILQTNKSNNFFIKAFSFLSIGSFLTPGSIDFKDLLKSFFIYFLRWQTLFRATYSSLKRIQILLIKKINLIYSKQQIYVSLKHFEVLIRHLTSFIQIIYDRSYCFYLGEIISLTNLINISTTFRLCSEPGIYYEPLILGLTKISLHSNSFLSAASFQKTTIILAAAAIEGKLDWLVGLKENIMLGQTNNINETFTTHNCY